MNFLLQHGISLKALLVIFSVVCIVELNAQISPGIEWRKSTHSPKGLNGQNQTFEQSGEEWWYSHKNVYTIGGEHTSYVTVGYTSLVSTIGTFSAAQQVFNEGPDSPYNPIDTIKYNYNTLQEGCSDRDYLGEHRTPARGNLGLNSLNGDMIYCKPKTIGALEEVILDPANPNFVYVVGVHLGVRPYKNKTDFIPYNPTASKPGDYFSIRQLGVTNYTNDIAHLYVAKINLDGTVIWEGLYGYVDYAVSPLTAYETVSYGYDIIKNSNGKLVVLGFGQQNNSQSPPGYPLLFEIDANTGYLLKKAILPITGNNIGPITNTITGNGTGGIGHSLAEIGSSGNYAVATTYYFNTSNPNDNNNAYVWSLDKNFNPNSNWPNNPMRFPGNGQPSYNSSIWEIKYHEGLKQILVPVIRDCFNCASAGISSGQGFIYRLDTNGILSSNGINPSAMGPINAFDLRIGVEETSDGGFVAVSSTRPPAADHSPATLQELGYLAGCAELYFDDWDSDALVIKYTSNGETQWSKTFDVADNRPRQTPPGDLKRQECLYKITQAKDGGYVISGNSSGNFDDFYMAKIYYECNIEQPFITWPGNVINIVADTTWNTSQTVLGKIIIHPGVVLTITGPTTTICFADSKLSGIETNITVKLGALLNITHGAKLTAVDTARCKNSKWDGVKLEVNPSVENSLLVYPNPAQNNFNLLYNGKEADEYSYSIIDVLGKEIAKGTVTNNLSSRINSENFDEGVYFITLNKNNKVFQKQKLVIFK